MPVVDEIKESGWGAIFLFIYSAGLLYVSPFELDRLLFAVAAATPSLVLVYLSISYNDTIMEILAGNTIRSTFVEIKKSNPEGEFYWDAGNEIKNSIDEMDQKAHHHTVSVLSGLVISASLPFAAWIYYGFPEVAAGILAALVIGYILSYRSYCNLQQVIKSSMKVYDNNDES